MGLWNLTFSSYGALKGGGGAVGWGRGLHISIFYRTTILSKAFIPYCSHKWPKTFSHSYAALLFIKKLFCKTNHIFYSLENQIWDEANKWSWKYIKNKGKVTLGSFQNFAYVNSYLHLKSFAWKREYLTSQKLQMPNDLIKTILKSCCRVLLDTCKFTASRQPVFLLRAVEF